MAKNSKSSVTTSKSSKARWDQRTVAFVAVLLVAIVGTYFLTRSYAAPKVTSIASGSCSTNPTTPTVGPQAYSLIGSNIPSGYQVYQGWVNGGKGLTVIGFNVPDGTGSVSNNLYPYYTGTYTAQIRGINYSKNGTSKVYDLADCSYTIQ